MAKNYVMAGYTTPAGITDAAGVKKVQQMLGVTADGVWGPQTQRAYNARMDGISDSHYPNNEQNARMRDVSAPYHSQSTQYQNIRGISDPYFSGGDEYVAYTDYLNERAQRNNSSADDEPVIEVQVRKSLGGGNSTQKRQEEWMKQVSASLPGASTLGTGKNPWGGSMPYTQDPYDILAQRTAAQQAVNGFGAFRLAAQKSDEEMLRRENGKKAIDTGKDAAKTYGSSAGLMPVPQYGQNPATGSMPYGVYPPTLPWQAPDYSTNSSHGGDSVGLDDAVEVAESILKELGKEPGEEFSKVGGKALGYLGWILKGVNLGSTINQDLNDEDGKLGLPTLKNVAGIIGGALGTAVGGLASPAGAIAGSYIGDQLFTELAEEIYYAEPVPYGEAVERARKYSSPYMPWYDPSKYLK